MSDDDPIRLKDAGDVSPELLRALRALRDHPSEAARLSRVAEKLEATLADVPAPSQDPGGLRLAGMKMLIVGVLAVGVAAVTWFGYQRERPAANQPKPRDTSSAERSPSAVGTGDKSGPRLADDVTPPAATPLSDPAGPSRREAHRTARPRDPKSAPRESGPSTPLEPTTPSANAAAEAKAAGPAAQPTAAADTTAARTDDTPRAPAVTVAEAASARPAAVTKPDAARPSEAALLFEARKAVRAQPSAALQFLEQHAQRFPDGVLAPEREVLWIEALQKLGRTSEAEQRRRAFESRYPDSIHLRRLQSNPR
jgi:hypothetical protein